MAELKGTKTEANLLTAFSGESQLADRADLWSVLAYINMTAVAALPYLYLQPGKHLLILHVCKQGFISLLMLFFNILGVQVCTDLLLPASLILPSWSIARLPIFSLRKKRTA